MTLTRLIGLVAVVATAAFILASPALAQEEAGGGNLFSDIIQKGGPIGIVILILSVATLALIIEFSVNVRRDKICPPELVDEIEALLEEEEYQEALELCEAEPNFLTNSLAT